MKKILSCVMALSIAATAAMSAGAANLTPSSTTGTAKISLDVASTYTVSIPADKTMTGITDVNLGTVSASDVKIGDTDNLTVTVSSVGELSQMKCADGEGDHYISYELQKNDGTKIENNGEVLKVVHGSVSGEETLKLGNLSETNATCAGTYSDLLTFKVAVGA